MFAFVLVFHLLKSFGRLIGHRLLPLFTDEKQLRGCNWLAWGQLVSALDLKSSLMIIFLFLPPRPGCLRCHWAGTHRLLSLLQVFGPILMGTIYQNTDLGRRKFVRMVCLPHFCWVLSPSFNSYSLAGDLTSVVFSLKWFCPVMWSSNVSISKFPAKEKNGWRSCGRAGDLNCSSYSYF